MHGCLKRRFATHPNASKILFGCKFKMMLKTSQICCLWADGKSLIKKRHIYYRDDRRVAITLLKRESCSIAQSTFLYDNTTLVWVLNATLPMKEIIMAGTTIISLMNVMWHQF
jgi:hypothetical protein